MIRKTMSIFDQFRPGKTMIAHTSCFSFHPGRWDIRVKFIIIGLSPEASRILYARLFLTVKPDYRRQNVTDARRLSNAWPKPAHFGDPCRSTTLCVATPVLPSPPAHKIARLPGHLVGLVTLPQAERAGEVRGKHIDLLDVGNQSLVDSLLVGGAAAVDLLLL